MVSSYNQTIKLYLTMALTREQIDIIRSTVPVIRDHGNAITTSFYSTLLDEVPDLNGVFNTANQRNGHQASALSGALYAYASNIDDLGALSPAVEKICQKHASLYIRPEQYDVVGRYLLRAMGDVLGQALTPEVLDAWGAAYWQLANLFMKREEQLMHETDGWTDWREFKIAEKVKESEEITSFYLQPTDGRELPSFLPGQYISVLVDVPELQYQQPRQYSLSDAPSSKYYRISVKKEPGLDRSDPDAVAHPGYVSNVLHDTKAVGDTLKLSHPAGEFFLDPDKEKDVPVVLVSAGVGLTPMISILNTLTTKNSKQRISFIHAARTNTIRAFYSHIQDEVAHHSNVSYTSFIKTPHPEKDVEGSNYGYAGRLDLNKLDQTNDLFLDDQHTLYFICGPTSFMTDVKAGLVEMGADADRIKLELFGTAVIPVE